MIDLVGKIAETRRIPRVIVREVLDGLVDHVAEEILVHGVRRVRTTAYRSISDAVELRLGNQAFVRWIKQAHGVDAE